MSKDKDAFTKQYPTQRARTVADVRFDALPMSTTLAEAVRTWEWEYLHAGGIICLPRPSRSHP